MQRQDLLRDRKQRMSALNILINDVYDISKDINHELKEQETKYIEPLIV